MIFEEKGTDFIRINFAMQRCFIKEFLYKLNVYNLDVLNLFNFYNTKTAKEYIYSKLSVRSAKQSINEYLKLRKQGFLS